MNKTVKIYNMHKRLKIIFLIFCLLILSCVPRVKPVRFLAEPEVRVALLTEQERITITATTPYTIYSDKEKRALSKGTRCRISHFDTVTVQDALWLKAAKFPIQIKPDINGLVKIGERTYRGYLEVRKDPAGKLTIINVLPLEKYLYSVVACEIGKVDEKTFQAAKAQAIAARSYTISHFGWFKNLGFDVFASYQRDQEYRGTRAEIEMTTKAVNASYGLVAVYREQAIEAKYHSTCGGFTAGAKAPYLRAHPDTPGHRKGKKPFCRKSPNFIWRKKFSQKEFLDNLIKIIPNLKEKHKIKSIKLQKERHSQRNQLVNITVGRNRYKIKSDIFRQGFSLKSNLYSIKITRRLIIITGHGYGHGLGLCQYGSLEMSRKGYSSEAIINHYYPGIKVKKLY